MRSSSQNRVPDTHKDLVERAIQRYKDNSELTKNVKSLRKELNEYRENIDKLEEDLKSLQNSGQLIGEVLKQLADEKCKPFNNIDIVKLLNAPRYVVTCKKAIDQSKLKVGVRIALDFSTLTIMRILPREIDPAVYNMMMEGKSY